MWRLFQTAIIGAVLGSNIQWQWTPNPYLAAVIGIGCAYGATWLLSRLIDLLRARRGKKQVHEGVLTGRGWIGEPLIGEVVLTGARHHRPASRPRGGHGRTGSQGAGWTT